MRKLYREIAKIIQRINYYIVKGQINKNNNILLCSEFTLERLTDDIVCSMSREIRINKCFPAGKSFFIDVNSQSLTFEIVYKARRLLDNMDNIGTSGIDIYIQNAEGKYVWKDTIAPNDNFEMYVKREITLGDFERRIKILLPSFAVVEGIYINPQDYRNIVFEKRIDIVAYGSSITHGCAASRPGLNYLNQLSFQLNCGIGNFGFSESAKGESELLEYISKIPSKIFIMEYDHNVDVEGLRLTHKRAYQTVRKNFNGWIIMLSRFSGGISISLEEECERKDIIRKTYDFAISNGDRKIVWYDGSCLFKNDKENYFIDGVHPNDVGMNEIAKKIRTIIAEKGMLE